MQNWRVVRGAQQSGESIGAANDDKSLAAGRAARA
jgi:hypothetical protein